MTTVIANPVYDAVFKYLLEDNDIAKLMISTIIGEEIEELDFLPQEGTVELRDRSLTVYRLDFSAKIRTSKDEVKQVIIEIQKAKYSTDIMRFRRYLGQQYSKKDNVRVCEVGDENGGERKKAIPILTIYFLGHKLKKIKAAIVKVKRDYIDLSTNETIEESEDFIESLTHDSYVIQVPYLKGRFGTDLEKMLHVFSQEEINLETESLLHELAIEEEDYPQRYKPIIRRLQRAIAEPSVKAKMDVEDDILEELQNKERLIASNSKTIEEKDKEIEAKDRAIEAKDRAMRENQRLMDEKIAKLKEELELLKNRN